MFRYSVGGLFQYACTRTDITIHRYVNDVEGPYTDMH